jgi:hypothetical protein
MCKFASFDSRANAEALADARQAGAAWNALQQAKQQHERQPVKRQREITSAFDFAFEFGASSYSQASSSNSFNAIVRPSSNIHQQVAAASTPRPESSAASPAAPSVDKWRSQLDAGLTDVSSSAFVASFDNRKHISP